MTRSGRTAFSLWRRRGACCGISAVVGLLAIAPAPAQAQMMGQGMGHGVHGHGADGSGHDEVNMPGLRGLNATPEESAELAVMFRNFQTITREVSDLPNGIRTVTRSSDPAVMETLVSHVAGMIGRVEAGDDPQVFIQSPTLDILFARGDAIETRIDVTDAGIVVVQTSDDPEIVAALQLHAGEVSDMADRGMQAALRYLAGLGHRRIAYLAGPPSSSSNAERLGALERLRPGAVVVPAGSKSREGYASAAAAVSRAQCTATSQPWAAASRAQAAPMPRLAPVMSKRGFIARY